MKDDCESSNDLTQETIPEIHGEGQDGSSASHSKTMSSIQQRVSENQSEIESAQHCGICMEEKIKQEMFKSTTCPHSFCKSCISRHVSAKTSDGITKVNCPEPSCKVKLEPRNCKSFVPQTVVERWEMMIIESEMGSKRMYCPYRDCSAVIVDVEDRDRDVTSAKCPKCHRLFSECREVNWEGIMDKKFMEIAHKKNWKKCPSCKFYVQKSSGCNSIKCRCGSHFCYACGKSYSLRHSCHIQPQEEQMTRECLCYLMSTFVVLILCIWFASALFTVLTK